MPATIPKRQPKRSRVLLSACLEGSSGKQSVLIRDISTNGALVEVTLKPIIGEGIKLSCGDRAMNGQVAWVDGSWVGVEFTAPLTTSILVDTIGNQLRVSAPREYRHDRISPAD